ncbi:FecR family protein [Flavivirga jejuensis]|uniref:DUF4974 domain-containing protein n=1 Tax=Flavivirga jejuensis TaxID=870487 RepID=A0ABT8WKY5_9FLAO|nr:FecR family protein [Flavivirga jejuensis]MDO5973778.1 DUF4974 domain-containing protein [Flavivirga jejuensis]
MKNIITKFIANTITEDELELLCKWLENHKNQNEFKQYILDYHDLNITMLKNDADKAFNRVKKSIDNPTNSVKVIRLFKTKYLKYAAVAVLLISSSYFFLKRNEIVERDQITVSTGTDKATLTFEDGTSVVLEKGQLYKTDKVVSNGEQLVYNKTKIDVIVYNYLTVPRGGKFELTLADGTKVWLNSASKLKYPVAFKEGVTREVELIYGEGYFDVSSSKNHNSTKFNVVSKFQKVEVLGTEFNIKAYQDEEYVYTTLIEGKVAVSNEVYKENLNINEQSILDDDHGIIRISDVNVYNETAWKKGIFSFRDKSLKDITKALSRWYDVDFVFKNKALETMTFNGVLSKSKTLEGILTAIKRNVNLNYKIYDKKIVLE